MLSSPRERILREVNDELKKQDLIREREALGSQVTTRFPKRSLNYIIGELWLQLQASKNQLADATFREDMGK